MTRPLLIAAALAIAVVCVIQTADGKTVRRLWNTCSRRCIRDCRTRRNIHSGTDHLKACKINCYEFAQSCKVCSSVKTGCNKCSRGYTLVYGNKCIRQLIEQWVAGVDSFSSEYTSTNWSASQIIGKPDVYPSYGDIIGAWAPFDINSQDYIAVYFNVPVYAFEIDIYETFNAGRVVKVSVFDDQNKAWVPVWQTDRPRLIDNSRIFSVPVSQQNFPTRKIRLDVDSRTTDSWVEIDAVLLKGFVR